MSDKIILLRVLVIWTLMLLLFSGCAPVGPPEILPNQLVPIQPGTSAWVFNQAISGQYGTSILARTIQESRNGLDLVRQQFIFVQTVQQGAAFVAAEVESTAPMSEQSAVIAIRNFPAVIDNGQISNYDTWLAFKEFLLKIGFTAYQVSRFTLEWVKVVSQLELIPVLTVGNTLSPDWYLPFLLGEKVDG